LARPGYPLIFASAFVTGVFALLDFAVLTFAGLGISLFICWFFRDPDRVIPNGDGIVVSPADGKVIIAENLEDTPFYDGPCLKISIFMSVFNVHVNRVPHEGIVKKISYYPGKFFSANLDKASRLNEHNAVFLETETGSNICFVQIAGLVARRIICRAQEEDRVLRGQRFGMICFGSRLDVYLPENTRLEVAVGDTVRAGNSTLGYLT